MYKRVSATADTDVNKILPYAIIIKILSKERKFECESFVWVPKVTLILNPIWGTSCVVQHKMWSSKSVLFLRRLSPCFWFAYVYKCCLKCWQSSGVTFLTQYMLEVLAQSMCAISCTVLVGSAGTVQVRHFMHSAYVIHESGTVICILCSHSSKFQSQYAFLVSSKWVCLQLLINWLNHQLCVSRWLFPYILPVRQVPLAALYKNYRYDRKVVCSQFSGAVKELQKWITRFVMSVHPSVRLSTWNNSAPTGRIFTKFGIRGFFENLSRK
jgi:hypothetical protein